MLHLSCSLLLRWSCVTNKSIINDSLPSQRPRIDLFWNLSFLPSESCRDSSVELSSNVCIKGYFLDYVPMNLLYKVINSSHAPGNTDLVTFEDKVSVELLGKENEVKSSLVKRNGARMKSKTFLASQLKKRRRQTDFDWMFLTGDNSVMIKCRIELLHRLDKREKVVFYLLVVVVAPALSCAVIIFSVAVARIWRRLSKS